MDYLKKLKHKWQRFQQYSPFEQRWLVQALVLLPLVALSLRVGGLSRTQTWLKWLLKLPTGPVLNLPELALMPRAEKISELVGVAVRYNRPWATCLNQSLLLEWLLRRQHIDSQLRVGVRRTNGKFEAHAWVECQGSVLNDSNSVAQSYAPFSGLI